MSFDTTARGGVAPQTEEQFHRLPADGSFAVLLKVEEMIDTQQAKVIDRLREAAREHGEVAALLETLAECFPLLAQGDASFRGDDEERAYLLAAIGAAAFVSLDRNEMDRGG